MLGRVAFAEGKHAEALAQYREAIGLDAGFRGDPVLLEHLEQALGESRNAEAALDLAIDKVGAPAADLLVKVANESAELARRQRAAAALDEMGKGDRVDRVGLAMLQLKRSRGCEEKKVLRREAARPRRPARAPGAARPPRPQHRRPLPPGRREHALHEEGAPGRHQGARVEVGRRGGRRSRSSRRPLGRMSR